MAGPCRQRAPTGGIGPRHHRVAPRGVVQLVGPAVAPAAVDLQEVRAGAAKALRRRCGGDVHGLILGLQAAAASARTLPPSSPQRSASHRAWVARLSIMIAPPRSAICRRPAEPAPVSAELPRRPIEPKPTISESTPTGSSTPPTAGKELAERIGPAAGVKHARGPRISDRAIRRVSLAVPARSAPPPAAGASRGSPTRRAPLQHEDD
jgi:hypothetical protein